MINKVINTDIISFLDSVDDESADLIIADPPYGIGIDKWDIFKDNDSYWQFMNEWVTRSIPKLKNGGSFYIFNNQLNSALTISLVKNKLHFNNWITWYKKDGFSPSKTRFVNNQETILFFSKGKPKTFNFNDIRQPYLSEERIDAAKSKGILKNGKRWFPNPNGRLCTDVWEIPSERHSLKKNGRLVSLDHPTTKPTRIIERIIIASSNKGDLVLDLFSGSGVTTITCKNNERNSLGCDISSDYCNNICNKLGGN